MSDVAQAQEVAPAAASGEPAPQDDWKSSLPEDLRMDPSIANQPSVESMGRSYVSAQRMVGLDKIAVPTEHSTDEEWSQVYDKLGRPESPAGYDLEMNNIPEGLEANPQLVDWFAGTAHDIGLTPRQAQALADRYNVMAGEVEQSPDELAIAAEAKEQEGVRSLQREYGKAFDAKIGTAKAVLNQYGGEELLEMRLEDGTALASNPSLVRTLVNIGDFMQGKLGEDTLRGAKTGGNAMTPADAQRELNTVQVQGGPYWDNMHPGHAAAVAESLRLNEFIHGTAEAS
jgi:hypothetical protein